MTLLAARGIAVKPPGASKPVLRDIDLDLAHGEWLALAGANGCGKTTLLLSLAGLWPLSAGHVELEGRSFDPTDLDARRRIAVVLQDPASQVLQPTVADEVAFGPRNQGMPHHQIRAGVEEWAARFGLTPDLERDPSRLSAGRQQLMLLAAALITRPDLLCADEATAHLDADNRTRVLEAIDREVDRGMAVIWITQSAAEIGRCHRLLDLGSASDVSHDRERLVPPASGPHRLEIRIAPDSGGVGPRVSTGSPVHFGVPGRGVVALEGPNGAGKSVLLSAIAGLEPSPQVEVTWLEPPLPPPIVALQYPEQQVFEETARDEVVFAAVSRGLARREALEAALRCLEALEIPASDFLARPTWNLTTGEKRILEVIAALVAPACLVLLDEPTAGLDALRRSKLGRLVAERAERDPLIVASQDLEWVRRLSALRIGWSSHSTLDLPSPIQKTD